jgi:tetratricopeptide (TPR) repeat protein
MRERVEAPNQYAWIVYAIAMIIVGGLVGYILATNRTATTIAVPAAAGSFNEAVETGNRLYDAHQYAEAIPYYQQALTFNPSDVGVSTDLGTALWYVGRADAALAQYDRSLAIDRNHAQTLFNLGIVRADGKHDYAGAIAAWETLLKTNPDYPAVDKVRSLIADARAKS